MSNCIRNGVTYRRHKWENEVCAACGVAAPKVEALNVHQFIPVKILPSVLDPTHELSAWEGEGGA
jgi:hypothetical protein